MEYIIFAMLAFYIYACIRTKEFRKQKKERDRLANPYSAESLRAECKRADEFLKEWTTYPNHEYREACEKSKSVLDEEAKAMREFLKEKTGMPPSQQMVTFMLLAKKKKVPPIPFLYQPGSPLRPDHIDLYQERFEKYHTCTREQYMLGMRRFLILYNETMVEAGMTTDLRVVLNRKKLNGLPERDSVGRYIFHRSDAMSIRDFRENTIMYPAVLYWEPTAFYVENLYID